MKKAKKNKQPQSSIGKYLAELKTEESQVNNKKEKPAQKKQKKQKDS